MSKKTNMGLRSIPFPCFQPTDAAIKFCKAYKRLAIRNRRKVDHFLLQSALLPDGTNAYRRPGQKWNEVDRHACYMWLRDISQEMAVAWLNWAREISKARPSPLACRVSILGLLCRLVSDESVEEQALWSPRSVAHVPGGRTSPSEASSALGCAERSADAEATTIV
jgi:hypothetical protein